MPNSGEWSAEDQTILKVMPLGDDQRRGMAGWPVLCLGINASLAVSIAQIRKGKSRPISGFPSDDDDREL